MILNIIPNGVNFIQNEEIETKIKPLAEAGNKSKCRFVFALHPYMYNAIRYNSEENYQA